MRRRLAIVLAATAGLGVAAAGAWLLLGHDQPRPAVFRAEPTSALYAVIDSRQADAAPLTLDEVFTPATRTLGPLNRVSAEQLADCDEALWGAAASGCTQALRATYTGPSGAGQFVIFNLPDGRSADALVAALAKDGFVRQAVSFDPKHSRAAVRALGHYVTVSWAGAGGPQAGTELVTSLIALDRLGHVVQSRVLAAG
ncbi:hypothetical protein [Nonomuraea sp. NPDC048916]|uniref:hypothetical protein n=1 Tax=Nonomuraea sp. NPDC048916 TaxID=3154232 RepID=UPI0033E28661